MEDGSRPNREKVESTGKGSNMSRINTTIKGSSLTVRKMGQAQSLWKMGQYTKASGRKGKRMGKENSWTEYRGCLMRVSGKMERKMGRECKKSQINSSMMEHS